jgi:hypothetical protein
MARSRCGACGKFVYTSRKDAHRAMGKLKNQFAYWSKDCRCYHTSSTRTAVKVRPQRQVRRRDAA